MRSYSQARDFKQALIRRQPGISLYNLFSFSPFMFFLSLALRVSLFCCSSYEIIELGDG
jgi:hypothetical protein